MYNIPLENLVENHSLGYHNLSPLVREELERNPGQIVTFKNHIPKEFQKESKSGRGELLIGKYLEDELHETVCRQHSYLMKEIEEDGTEVYHLRKPDFYLPKYELVIEFNGWMKSEEGIQRYENKKVKYEYNETNALYITLSEFKAQKYEQILTERLKEEAKKLATSEEPVQLIETSKKQGCFTSIAATIFSKIHALYNSITNYYKK